MPVDYKLCFGKKFPDLPGHLSNKGCAYPPSKIGNTSDDYDNPIIFPHVISQCLK